MHCDDITDIILNEGLKTTVGKTPSYTVAGIISRLRSSGAGITKFAPGVYGLSDKAEVQSQTTQAIDVEGDELDTTDATQNLAVAAYGLYWERGKVDWSAKRILGFDRRPTQAIDFADQQGVYLLHNWQSVVYVGRTAAKENGLFQRLNEHHTKHTWSGKWERFSWFGIRPVDEEGRMLDGPDNASKTVVTALMEAVLIETLGPSFNNRPGNYMGRLYHQLS